jgi:uncharacterized membrane protein YkvA (DUF1232 family)
MSAPAQLLYTWYRNLVSNPKYRWWIVAGTLIYVLNPFDFAPDFLPFIGQLDDAMLVSLLATELVQVLGDRRKASKQQSGAAQNTTTVDVEAVGAK